MTKPVVVAAVKAAYVQNDLVSFPSCPRPEQKQQYGDAGDGEHAERGVVAVPRQREHSGHQQRAGQGADLAQR
ncbi:hypothetical protein [Streptomyces diastatochromogenes]|uniref:hypothetical protein n=1 Tax=Streptomyces diastatochromogenes TaxID=42236 RepID=UPI0036A815EF